MKIPHYLKLKGLCRELGINYNRAYFGRLEPHEKTALEKIIVQITKIVEGK